VPSSVKLYHYLGAATIDKPKRSLLRRSFMRSRYYR
jgi:hypothetical protein